MFQPTDDPHAGHLRALGMEFKQWRSNSGEQFCIFAFDFESNVTVPSCTGFSRDSVSYQYELEEWDETWIAAYWNDTNPNHTEKFIFDHFGPWINKYSGIYGDPRALYIYSLNIPLHREYDMTDLYVGWSNNGFSYDDSVSAAVMMADAEEDSDIRIHLRPGLSIAGDDWFK